jgi:hypothetical protein
MVDFKVKYWPGINENNDLSSSGIEKAILTAFGVKR